MSEQAQQEVSDPQKNANSGASIPQGPSGKLPRTFASLFAGSQGPPRAPLRPSVRLSSPQTATLDIPLLFDRPNSVAYETVALRLPYLSIFEPFCEFVASLREREPSIDYTLSAELRDGSFYVSFKEASAADEVSKHLFEINSVALQARRVIGMRDSDTIYIMRLKRCPHWSKEEAEPLLKEALSPYGRLIHLAKLTTNVHSKWDFASTSEWQLGLETGLVNTPMPPSEIEVEYDDFPYKLRVTPPLKATWCSYCRAKDHTRSTCPKAEPCHNCGLKGHLQRYCRRPRGTRSLVNAALSRWSEENAPESEIEDPTQARAPHSLNSDREEIAPTGVQTSPPQGQQQKTFPRTVVAGSKATEPNSPLPPGSYTIHSQSPYSSAVIDLVPSHNFNDNDFNNSAAQYSNDWAADTEMQEFEGPAAEQASRQ